MAKKRQKDEPQAIHVYWQDACTRHEWHDADTIRTRLVAVHDVGFLVKETKKTITLVSRIDENGNTHCQHVIPRSQILRPARLKRWRRAE